MYAPLLRRRSPTSPQRSRASHAPIRLLWRKIRPRRELASRTEPPPAWMGTDGLTTAGGWHWEPPCLLREEVRFFFQFPMALLRSTVINPLVLTLGGSNPKLWQRRCEDYFQRWQTPVQSWTSLASDQFTRAAATWLEAHLHQHSQPPWTEFVTAVMTRFCRNQHAILVRRLIHISWTSTVEDYVTRYSELMDQISAYELNPVHYTTKSTASRPGYNLLLGTIV
jgi:hypothetical protein